MIEIDNKVTFNCCHPGCKESLILKNKRTIAEARKTARSIGWRCPREKGQAHICFCPKHWVWDVRHKATDLIEAAKEDAHEDV